MTKKSKWLIVLAIIVGLIILCLAKKVVAPKPVQASVIAPTSIQASVLAPVKNAQATSSSVQLLEFPIPVSLSERVEKDFSKRMVAVVKCESNFRQFESDGTVVLSPTMDVGLFQINLKAHLKQSQKMGLDIINSLEDNYTYAKHLFDQQGEAPWVCSRLI